jgi:hypothetical protein
LMGGISLFFGFHINLPNKKNHFFFLHTIHLIENAHYPSPKSLFRKNVRASSGKRNVPRQVRELVQDTHVLAHLIGLKPRLFGSVGRRVLDAVVLVLGRGLHCVILATHVVGHQHPHRQERICSPLLLGDFLLHLFYDTVPNIPNKASLSGFVPDVNHCFFRLSHFAPSFLASSFRA